MSMKKHTGSAWENITSVKRYSGGSWVNCSFVKKYVDGEWKKIYPTDYYLIKDGKYQVDFSTTSVWSYSLVGSSFKVTEGDGYIQIYNMGYSMGAIITSNTIDLSQYSTINIEADISMYTSGSTYLNRAAIGAYDSIPDALGYGSTWTPGTGTIFYKDFYTVAGNSTTFVSVSKSYSISNYTADGHIFVYGTSYNLGSDYSYVRIKNLWLM